MNILIDDEYRTIISEEIIIKTVQFSLKYEGMPAQSDLSVVISDNAKLQELNNQFLGIDAPTDVLSFPSDEVDPDSGEAYLGDIILSLPQAKKQADEAGHSLTAETQLLVVHGMLHLLGYDHAEDSEKREMWDHQKAILDGLGTQLNRFPE
jgi:probable rRNA maturation factor